MHTIVEQLRKELLELALFADTTVENYISCVYKYFDFAKEHLNIDPLKSEAPHLRQWITHLKKTNISFSRLGHHQAALKHFFAFLEKMNLIDTNPADALFPIRKVKSDRNQPISKQTAFKLLRSIDRSTWIGERNFMIISFLWALGLRRSELTSLRVRHFEPNHDPDNKIGLLRIRGKGKKQRALFVVDKLYDNLLNYLKHPQSPKKKLKPLFPSKNGTFLTGDHVAKIVKQAAQKAGIKQRITPHVLRHSFATEMYLIKVELDAIQDMMGHDSEAETAIYIHVPDKLKKKALEQLTIDGRLSWK